MVGWSVHSHLSHGHLPIHDERTTVVEDQDSSPKVQVASEGGGQTVSPGIFDAGPQRLTISFVVSGNFRRLSAEGFDGANVGESLRRNRVAFCPGRQHLSVEAL